MMSDRNAVSRPDQAVKSSVKLPNNDDESEYVGMAEGHVRVFNTFSALSKPELCHTVM